MEHDYRPVIKIGVEESDHNGGFWYKAECSCGWQSVTWRASIEKAKLAWLELHMDRLPDPGEHWRQA